MTVASSSTPAAPAPSRTSRPWLFALLLGLITLLAGGGNLLWVRTNVVLVGRDATAYFGKALEQFALLSILNPQTLFQAVTSDDYRAPAIYLAAQPFMSLFGPSADGAQMLNVLLGAAIVPLTYMLARQVATAWTSLFAALLVALLPMIAAMGRLFYTEALLTVAVTVCLIALYRCHGFARRDWALVWGVGLGVGMLTKWTLPLYIGLPTLWMLYATRRELRAGAIRLRWRSVLLALVVALGFVLLWYWPNRAALANFVLGGWIFWAWLVTAFMATYVMLEGRGPLPHFAAALLLAAWIASLWYLPYVNIVNKMLAYEESYGSAYQGIFALNTYTRYFNYFVNEHLGRLATWIIAPIVLFPWLRELVRRLRKHRSDGRLWRNTTLLWLSLLLTYVGLALLAQANARNLVAVLPALCVLAALALADYRPPLRNLLGTVVVGVLLTQWLVLTVDRFAPLYAMRSLWAGSYASPPAFGPTDPAYAIGPQILKELAAHGPDRQEVGMLVNSNWLHRGSLRNTVREENLPVQIRDLTEADATWTRLITSPWLLAKDGENRDVEPEGKALIARIATDPLFARLFAPERVWEVPTGDRVTLYRRSAGPDFAAEPAGATEQAAAAVDLVHNGWSEHATLVYTGLDRAAWISRADPPAERSVLAFDAAGLTVDALAPLTGTLFVVLEPDMGKAVRRLDAEAYKVADAGGDFVWVSVYGKPDRPLEPVAVEAAWRGHMLEALQTLVTLRPGEVIPLDVRFAGSTGDLKWSVRLVAGDGTIVAASDRVLAPSDRFGLLIPPATAPGVYALVAVAYDPATLAPIPADDGRDTVRLTEISVQP